MLKNRYSASGDRLRIRSASAALASPPVAITASKTSVTANSWGGGMGGAGVPVSGMPVGGLNYNKFFTGMLPEAEEALIPYYRDIYYFDSVAGATVDIIGSFPFSDFSLVGLDKNEIQVYEESMNRINVRSLMPQISHDLLVDGAFIGSLVLDPKLKTFQDVLIHDRLNCSISQQPLHAVDPIITANAAQTLNAFVSSDSPYAKGVLATYPRGFIETFLSGNVTLDPLTTMFIPRKGAKDQATSSYLKRILPMYLLEKVLYRGTLIEASKRMRATSHVTVGTDTWEPTPSELSTTLAQFQMSEMDPLGAWVVTRQGVQVQDIRTAGDFWKWTDLIDLLVPYKLRALSISEAFLAGDAAFSNAETAMSVFMENMASYRGNITHRAFRDKLFPLIAVIHGRYKDPSKVDKDRSVQALMRNLGNHSNLKIPEIRWHKNLDNRDPTIMDTLEKLGEKGIPVPLKMWAAAANVDLNMLVGDLEEDNDIRARIQAITGKKIDDGAGAEDEGMGYEEASLRNLEAHAEIRSTANPILSRRRSMLQRVFSAGMDTPVVRPSKSGNRMHTIYNEKAHTRKQDENICKALTALQDPHHRKTVRDRIISRVGRIPNIIGHDI